MLCYLLPRRRSERCCLSGCASERSDGVGAAACILDRRRDGDKRRRDSKERSGRCRIGGERRRRDREEHSGRDQRFSNCILFGFVAIRADICGVR
ncbi:hypothetical protein E6W36_04455 [Hankyongella ginsenosidimutans]|uniref:Uncharacterized protein n=1 Tax=Hankyongella ginsenosidimutans TaxID=1763828 RepID=A0A4D7C5V0_9SPHN|nr:hypothetical protein E6W36_04455 [Hankyongella ginsenosidimutans]